MIFRTAGGSLAADHIFSQASTDFLS
jgi:hypothetical protein